MSKISELETKRRKRFGKDWATWIDQLARQQRKEFQAICRTTAGKELIAERRALDAEFVRDISPIITPANLCNLHGEELSSADRVQRDYYLRCDFWQDRWNKLSESLANPTPAENPAELRTRPDRVAVAVALLKDHPDWSARKLAEECGCAASTLTRSTLFRTAKMLATNGHSRRRGWKSKDGTIEAVADD